MDLRTGRTYESREAALADGVPESDIAEVVQTPEGPSVRVTRQPFKAEPNPRYPARHQGTREMKRRQRQSTT
jgi:hypothetical protein